MAGQVNSRELSAREAVETIRGPLTNAQIMDKFKINATGYADLLKQLYEKKLITEQDIGRRGIRFKVVKRDTEPEKPPEQVAVVQPLAPPPLMEDEDEFLDTVTLTELLTFKPPEPPQAKEKELPKAVALEEPDPETTEKKSKFSITGLFKKS